MMAGTQNPQESVQMPSPGPGTGSPAWEQHIARGESERARLAEGLANRSIALPLGLWRQQAHFTVPVAAEAIARKAVEQGTAPMARILERLGVTAADLAERLEVTPDRIEHRLAKPIRSPLVMLDGEDAQPLRDDISSAAPATIARVLVEADWGTGPTRALRFFRPPGFSIQSSVRDIYGVLAACGARHAGGVVDGIIFPKIEHPEEAVLLDNLLSAAEQELGRPAGSIRVGLLIESTWALAQLPDIVRSASGRLASLIFGSADYSADAGLPAIDHGHPLLEWARLEIINVAAAVGVPAIDSMTLAYPVADPGLGAADNRARFLSRMELVYRDALHARALGMLGKWVGHPAQLFAVLLAFDESMRPAALEEEAGKLEAYRQAVEDGRGATIIGGVMSDRATDRHARALLRQATALGLFDPRRAVVLGVITGTELAEASASWDAHDEGGS